MIWLITLVVGAGALMVYSLLKIVHAKSEHLTRMAELDAENEKIYKKYLPTDKS